MKAKNILSILILIALILSGHTTAIAQGSTADEDPVGIITGVVTEEDTGKPISGISVSVYRTVKPDQQNEGANTTTDINGFYQFIIREGEYKLSFYDYDGIFINEFYDNLTSRHFPEATRFQVPEGATVTIDAALSRAGSINGWISPFRKRQENEWFQMQALDANTNELDSFTAIHELKDYRLGGLRTGQYKLFLNISVFRKYPIPSDVTLFYYNAKTGFKQAEVIEVTAGSPTEGINFDLTNTGTIRGVVIDEATKKPVPPRFIVRAYNTDLELAAIAHTDEDGNYQMDFLAPGEYTVLFTGLVWPETCIHGCEPSPGYFESGYYVKVQVGGMQAIHEVNAVVSPYFFKTYVPIVTGTVDR